MLKALSCDFRVDVWSTALTILSVLALSWTTSGRIDLHRRMPWWQATRRHGRIRFCKVEKYHDIHRWFGHQWVDQLLQLLKSQNPGCCFSWWMGRLLSISQGFVRVATCRIKSSWIQHWIQPALNSRVVYQLGFLIVANSKAIEAVNYNDSTREG